MTDATLKEIHQELPDKLQQCHGKPLMITVTYKDESNQLQHYICTNNDFVYNDIQITLNHLKEQAKKDLKPRNHEIAKEMKQQRKVRQRARLQRG